MLFAHYVPSRAPSAAGTTRRSQGLPDAPDDFVLFQSSILTCGRMQASGRGCRRAAGSRIQRIGHLAGAGPAPAARERGAAWGKWRGLAREHGPGGSVSGRTRRARSEPQRYRLRQALSAETRLGPPSTQQHRAALRPGHAGLRGAGSPDVGAGALQPRRAGPMPCHAMPWLAVTGDYVEPPTPRHSWGIQATRWTA